MQTKHNVSSVFVQNAVLFPLEKECLSTKKQALSASCGIGALLIFTNTWVWNFVRKHEVISKLATLSTQSNPVTYAMSTMSLTPKTLADKSAKTLFLRNQCREKQLSKRCWQIFLLYFSEQLYKYMQLSAETCKISFPLKPLFCMSFFTWLQIERS